MKKDLLTASIALVLLTVVLGIIYPLAITGVSQAVFPGKADGDRNLVAAAVMQGKQLDSRYFQPRPSATGYSPTATFFANRGPNAKASSAFFGEQLAAYATFNGVPASRVPVDAVTDSASGVDPDISQANAAIQARRVAQMRGMPLDQVQRLVRDNTDGRFLGVFGEPGVNVTELNRALEQETR